MYMIPALARDAVIIKLNFPNACMTGNYECAYACGVLSADAALSKEEDIQSIVELRDKTINALKVYTPGNDRMKRLFEMLTEYEPSEKMDDQMAELYYVGFDDKNV